MYHEGSRANIEMISDENRSLRADLEELRRFNVELRRMLEEKDRELAGVETEFK